MKHHDNAHQVSPVARSTYNHTLEWNIENLLRTAEMSNSNRDLTTQEHNICVAIQERLEVSSGARSLDRRTC